MEQCVDAKSLLTKYRFTIKSAAVDPLPTKRRSSFERKRREVLLRIEAYHEHKALEQSLSIF